jgi:hypothetical protein
VLDAQLAERPADLGEAALVDLAAGLGGQVRIPMKTATYSDAKRPPIPIQSGHFFSGPN